MGVSQQTQKVILTTAMLFNGIVTPSGIIYGWPGLAQLLKDEKEFASDCPEPYDPTKTCSSQDNLLSNIFTVGTNVATVATIVYGFTLNRFGVRANAVSGAILMALGFILMAFSTTVGDHKFNAFIPAFGFIAFGGLGTYLAAFQFSSLFERPVRILSVQSALFGAAGLTLTFFKFLYEDHGISRKSSCLVYAMVIGFCALNMILLYPAKAYKAGDTIHLPVLGWLGIQRAPTDSLDDQVVNGDKSTYTQANATDYSPLSDDPESAKLDVVSKESPDAMHVPSETEIEILRAERLLRDLTPLEKEQFKNSRSLREEIMNTGTNLLALHFSIGLLCSNLYNGNIHDILTDKGDSSGNFVNAFVYITSLYPMLFSLLIDELQKRYRYAGTSFLATALLASSFAFLFSNSLYAQLPAFFIFASGRALLITVMFSFVAVEYRGEHYGFIVAYITTICAIIGLTQLGLQAILSGPANNNFDYFTAGMIIAMTPLFYFSWWCHKNRT